MFVLIVLAFGTVIDLLPFSGNYRKAFFACRKHRIDLNVLVDHNEVAFLDGLSSFVDQIPEVDHINLFLTGLGCVLSFSSLDSLP